MKACRMAFALALFLFNPGLAQAASAPAPITRAQVTYQKAMHGDPVAQFQLASFYEKGQEGLDQDVAYALSWYEESARNGFAQAITHLKTLASAD